MENIHTNNYMNDSEKIPSSTLKLIADCICRQKLNLYLYIYIVQLLE